MGPAPRERLDWSLTTLLEVRTPAASGASAPMGAANAPVELADYWSGRLPRL